MCLIIEIIMTILGVVALFRGEVRVIGKNPVRGWPAYLIGALMAATLPLALATGVVVAVVIVASGERVDLKTQAPLFMLGDAGIVFGILVTSIVLSLVCAKEPAPPGFAQHTDSNASFPPRPSPPMDPNNPYAPPPDTGPNYPYQR